MHTTTSKVTIDAPASKVWAALTQPELVKQWQYGSDVITDWNVGSPIRYRSEWDGNVYEQWGTILAIEPQKMLKHSLFAPSPDVQDKPENYFTMIYTLDELDGKTTLTIAQEDPRPQTAAASQGDEDENGVLATLKKLVESL